MANRGTARATQPYFFSMNARAFRASSSYPAAILMKWSRIAWF